MRGPFLVVVAVMMVAGCTEYRPVHQRSGESWEQALRLAYRDDIAKHPVGQSTRVGTRPMAIGPGQHLVMQGETLSELAEHYRVSQLDMARLNRIRAPYHIYVGQILVLPDDGGVAVASVSPDTARDPGASVVVSDIPAQNQTGSNQQQPIKRKLVKLAEPVYPTYIVREGESLAEIGERHGYGLGDMLSVNQHIDPGSLRVGQSVFIPDESRARYPAIGREPMDPATMARIKQAAQTAPSALSDQGFLAPVDGPLIRQFGSLANGMHNDGINIKAAAGTPVRAAESGVVVFTGDDVGEYGRLLLIRHDQNFVTAYGHNSALLVEVGDRVSRGQPVARSGRSGDVSEPQLHFQIRKGSTPIDPRTRLVNAGAGTRG